MVSSRERLLESSVVHVWDVSLSTCISNPLTLLYVSAFSDTLSAGIRCGCGYLVLQIVPSRPFCGAVTPQGYTDPSKGQQLAGLGPQGEEM